MPIDDLTALGQKMREARKKKDLTQQELADLSHVSIKQIAKIEKGKINPSYLILKALAKVLPISLDTLINPDVSPEDEGATQMKILYCNCPSEMRETLLRHTQETAKELTELSEKFETKLKQNREDISLRLDGETRDDLSERYLEWGVIGCLLIF